MEKPDNLSHIKFGFRGEGILYKLNGREHELWSTVFDGIRVYFDNLRKTSLDENQKTLMFREIVQFVNQLEKEKPIICYNSDFSDAKLWEKLTKRFTSQIKSVEITNIQKENEALYKTMSESITTGLSTHKFKNGLEIKSKKYLDKHWDFIKLRKDSDSIPKISTWDKLLAKLNI